MTPLMRDALEIRRTRGEKALREWVLALPDDQRQELFDDVAKVFNRISGLFEHFTEALDRATSGSGLSVTLSGLGRVLKDCSARELLEEINDGG